MMKKIFAFTLAVLMLSVLLIPAVQAIMVHDHGEVCVLGATGDCCSNPNRKDYIITLEEYTLSDNYMMFLQ